MHDGLKEVKSYKSSAKENRIEENEEEDDFLDDGDLGLIDDIN